MTVEEIIRAFHLMWDGFPEPILLIKKSREIVAANKKAEAFGIKVGSKCSSYGKPEQHKGCRCNEAADEKKTIAVTYKGPFGKDAYGYWIPLRSSRSISSISASASRWNTRKRRM